MHKRQSIGVFFSIKLPETLISCQNEILEADKIIVLTSSIQGATPLELSRDIDNIFTEEFMFNLIAGGTPTFKCKKEFGVLSSDPNIVEGLTHRRNNFASTEFPYQKIIQNLKANLRFNILISDNQSQNGLNEESASEVRNALECLINSCDTHIPGKFTDMIN